MSKPSKAWIRIMDHIGWERLQVAEFVGRVNSVTQTITWEKDRFGGFAEPEVIKLSPEMFNWFWRAGEQDPELIECRWVIFTRDT